MKNFFGPQIKTAISLKADGPMNYVGHELFDGERRANRAEFLKRALGLRIEDTVTPLTSHGKEIAAVSAHNPILEMVKADAIMTDKKGLALTMGMADCPTLFLYDTVNEVIALVHCGWKSLVADIISHTLNGMRLEYNTNPKNLKAYIGPGICGECFEVKEDVAKLFPNSQLIYPGINMWKISLKEFISSQLVKLGVDSLNVDFNYAECTRHTTKILPNKLSPNGTSTYKYHSFRRDKSDPLQTGMVVMMMI